MNTTKRNYEALYIVDSILTDEQLETIINKYSQVILDQGGEIQAAGKWDRRRLAYEIKGRREGTYILMYFSGEPTAEKELDRLFKISDEVFRHIILRVEPERVDVSKIEQAAPSPESVREAVAPAAPVAPAAVEEAPAQAETPTEEAPAAEAPAEETPVAEAPVAEVPASEEPAAEAAVEATEE